jgi:hypothetical protein
MARRIALDTARGLFFLHSRKCVGPSLLLSFLLASMCADLLFQPLRSTPRMASSFCTPASAWASYGLFLFKSSSKRHLFGTFARAQVNGALAYTGACCVMSAAVLVLACRCLLGVVMRTCRPWCNALSDSEQEASEMSLVLRRCPESP